MRIPALTTSFALALALAACGSNAANDDANNAAIDANLTDDAANAALGTNDVAAAMPADANGFVSNVAASDMFEIESAKLAADKAQSPALKSFAAMLRSDHEKSTADLKTAAGAASPPLTVAPELDAEKQAMLGALKGLSGAEFDKAFVDQQKTAHQKALTLLNGYSGAAGDPLKDFAGKAATVVQGHLDKLNAMKL